MNRTLLVLLFGLIVAIAGGVLIWSLALQDSPEPPATSSVATLSASATIDWHDEGTAEIDADTWTDAYAALGYAHGTQRAWPIALWRQTALGQLSEWFGDGVIELDHHARQLRLARNARTAYDALPDAHRAHVDAYAEGLNAAWNDGALSQSDEVVLLDVEPDRWEPWHVLAIERLFAWLGTDRLDPPVAAMTEPSALAFWRADTQFRRWLHLHGFDRSTAWALSQDDQHALFQRHVYGDSALPVFQDIRLRIAEPEVSITATSLPGTPLFPTGRDEERAWTQLLRSSAELAKGPFVTDEFAVAHERLRAQDQREFLGAVPHTSDGLLLSLPSVAADTAAPAVADSLLLTPAFTADTRARIAPSDSVWQVRWSGNSPATDLPAWHELATGAQAEFELFDGTGLLMDATGDWTVTGRPAATASLPNGIMIGSGTWASHQAATLSGLLEQPMPSGLETLSSSDSSAWAADLLDHALPILHGTTDTDTTADEALTFLQNWRAHYGRTSIGASIFDTWMHQYRTLTDSLPRPLFAETEALPQTIPERHDTLDRLFARDRMYRSAFRQAVDTLAAAHGSDLSRWRWERVQPDRRFFPAWSADSLIAQDVSDLATTRYAPLERAGAGHPSTPSGGTSPAETHPPAPAHWEGWMRFPPDPPLTTRQMRTRPETFLGRHAAPDERPDFRSVPPEDDPTHTTTLTPPDS